MIRQDVRRVRVALGGLLTGVALLVTAGTAFAGTPTPGANCDMASIVGSDQAGKLRVGVNIGTCTLTFSTPWPKRPGLYRDERGQWRQGCGTARHEWPAPGRAGRSRC